MEIPDQRPARRFSDGVLLLALLCLAGIIHGWLIAHTYVPSRDTIGYIRYALQFDSRPWTEIIPHMQQHPLYPISVWLFSVPICAVLGGVTCDTMTLSAQAASTFAGVLLVIPMFYLGRELFDRRIGFWSAALFQCLPISAQITADGLSDALFFCLATMALWLGARGARLRSPWTFAGCGLFAGLAYLTRPEGALVAAAAGLTLLGFQAWRTSRWPWGKTNACAAALTAGFLFIGGPYMALIGGITVKPTSLKFMHLLDGDDTLPQRPKALSALTPRASFLLAEWWNDREHFDRPPLHWALYAFGKELVRTSEYILWLPAMLGFWWFRHRLRTVPGTWIIYLLCTLYIVVLCQMARTVGYLAERHALFLVLLGMPWAVAGLERIGVLLATGLKRWLPFSWSWAWLGGSTLAALLALAFLGGDFKPLHANRAGHRAAGEWLAAHVQAGDKIIDPFCWAHYYAGAVFREESGPAQMPVRMRYVVLENGKNPHSRLPELEGARQLAQGRAPVYQWTPQPGRRRDRAEEVVVYAVPAQP
jgi:4-amino-4-deoxy-L-arabinose transferase-like glycosyltransferase